jgi:outer membrane murein-binding lipoprotein Lpp
MTLWGQVDGRHHKSNDLLTMFGQIIHAWLSRGEATSKENFMIGSEWLRAKLTGNSGEADPSTNALLSDLAKNTEQVLAVRVNELLVGKSKDFAEAHESLVDQAIKTAREKVEVAELAKCAAEAELEQVKSEVEIKIRQIEEQMERAAFRLAAAEHRATAAEERADKAEASLKRLQAQIITMTYWKRLVPRAA